MDEIKIEIGKYINYQNQGIYEQLSKVYDIQLYLDTKLTSWVLDNDNPIIRTPKDNLDIPSFTHELLHLYIDYLGMTSKKYIFHDVLNVHVMISVKNDLFNHIYNLTCHKKMYPYFKSMGFSDVDFVQKSDSFYSQSDYILIKLFKRLNIFSKFWISQFIGHTISLMNDVVEQRWDENRKNLSKLSKLDNELFNVIYYFDSKWSNQESLDCIKNFDELCDGLLEWMKNNNKCKG